MDVNQDIKFIVKVKNKQNKSRGGGGRGGGAGRCEPRIEVIVKLKSRGVVG